MQGRRRYVFSRNDLGTTNGLITVWRNGKVEILKNNMGTDYEYLLGARKYAPKDLSAFPLKKMIGEQRSS